MKHKRSRLCARSPASLAACFVTPVLTLVVLSSACSQGLPARELLTPAQLSALPPFEEEKFGEAAARYLRFHDRWMIHISKSGDHFWSRSVHAAIRVRSQKGIDQYATVRIPFRKTTELTQLTARTISAEGQVTLVPAEEIFEAEANLSDDDDDAVVFKSFQFPRAQVGSILEYTWTTKQDGWRSLLTSRIAEDIPIADYRLEVLASKYLRYEMRLFHSDGQLKTRKEGSYDRIVMSLKDVPAVKGESFDPHWSRFAPWWQLRMKKVAFPKRHFKITQTWADAFKWIAQMLDERKESWFEGFDVKLKGLGCPPRDDLCRVNGALNFVRDRVEYDGFSSEIFSARELTKVLATERGDNFEKSLLLGALLADAGVDVKWAFISRNYTHAIDKDVPSRTGLNHLLLYVPKSSTLPGGIWLDPTCEYCAPGELPDWSRGADALVIEAERKMNGDVTGDAKWTKARGNRPSVPTEENRSYDVVLSDNGDVEVDYKMEALGIEALWERRDSRDWNEQEERDKRAKLVKKKHATGKLTSLTRTSCARATGRCSTGWSYKMPAWGTRDGEELLLPLNIFGHSWHSKFKKKKREFDVVFAQDNTQRSTLVVKVPPGFVPSDLPDDVELSGPGVTAKVKYAYKDGVLTVERTLTTIAGEYPKEEYEALRKPWRAWAETQKKLIAFRRAGEK